MAKNKKTGIVKLTFLERLDGFLQKHDQLFFWIIFILTGLVGMALYDPRVSLSGDDSGYILRANNLVKSFSFPGFQGPLYPMALSLIVVVSGISLFPLKLFSMLSMLAFMYMTFITFRKRIPASLLFSVLLLTSINSYVLYYASQTYSEAFYMFIQSLVVFVFLRFFLNEDSEQKNNIVHLIKRHLWLALALLGAALTRSVGFALIIAVCGYFLFYKQWKNLGLSIASVLILFLFYSLLKGFIWPESGFQLSGQGSELLLKNSYKPGMGHEDLSGFITRFLQNSNQYLSNGFFRIMGFQKGSNNAFVTILIYAIAIIGLFYSYKKNKSIFFSGLMTGAFLIVTFVSLQVFWNQERLIIPQYPYILLILLAAFYYFLSKEKIRSFQFLFIIPVIILFYTGSKETVKAIEYMKDIKTVYSGLTPDWLHYMKVSEWIGKNMTKEELVASRKPEISTIYSKGKPFYGIYSIPVGDKQLFMSRWNEDPNIYIAIPQTNNNFSNRTYQFIGKNHVARIEMGNNYFLVANATNALTDSLSNNNVKYLSANEFQQIIKMNESNEQYSLYYPDSLLSTLKNHGVTHLLSAQLRVHPNVKDGYTINTVERFAFFIQEKYPAIFEQVYQDGTDEDEPARIYRIRWEYLDK